VGGYQEAGRVAPEGELRDDEVTAQHQAEHEEHEAGPDVAADERRHLYFMTIPATAIPVTLFPESSARPLA